MPVCPFVVGSVMKLRNYVVALKVLTKKKKKNCIPNL